MTTPEEVEASLAKGWVLAKAAGWKFKIYVTAGKSCGYFEFYLVELDIGGCSAGWLQKQPAAKARGVGVHRAITGKIQI